MPILQSAVDDYLRRKIESRTWFKDLTPLEVEHDLSFLDPPHTFRIPMRIDQKICFLLGVAYPSTLFMTDLGLGKTGVSLELLTYFYYSDYIRRAFVFAPTDELVEGWEDEIKKWKFTIPYLRLVGSSKQKWEALDTFGDGVIIGTYAGISAMVSKMVPRKKNGVETGHMKRQPTRQLYDQILHRVDAVIFDQSTAAASRGSLTFKVCNHFSQQAQIRYALAGRTFNRDPTPLWSQFMLVDRGRAFGDTIGLFREAFFRREQRKWGTKWVIRKRRQKDLARFTAASSIRYAASECVELPLRTRIIKDCEFPKESWSYYVKERDALIASRGNWREVNNAFLRMRQITSGFVGFIDDSTDERAQIEFHENPKLKLTLDLIDEIPDDCKTIIFHEFNWSGRRLCEELKKRGIQHGWLWGGTKDWTDIKTRFNEDPEFKFLVMNWKKGSMGLNMQAANYTIFYESPVSALNRAECEGRTHRVGQEKRCFVYDPVMRDSVDETILDYHTEGDKLFKELIENPQKVLLK